jgi:23S rRNA (adenine2503-C2)-methyltransferase
MGNGTTIIRSEIDDSVNFILPVSKFVVTTAPGPLGSFEARYVRRRPEYISLYLSSQSGCNQGCRMCHLTASRQTKYVNASPDCYMEQARNVLRYYDAEVECGTIEPAEYVHFNFMARGEALDNRMFLQSGSSLLYELGKLADYYGLISRFLVSTIMPLSLPAVPLARAFPSVAPEIYYSLYSTKPEFRKKWLPHAMPVDDALRILKAYQDAKRVILKMHWALIAGENDSIEDAHAIADAVNKWQIKTDFALVQYNPYSPIHGQESDQDTVERYAYALNDRYPPARVKIIKRVGFDVKASCGMFIGKDGAQ